ncbi:hypothetical protein [Paenibacillus alkalitolerans]|uniref:hypothetical protein n=1 Tax=Paenibacillus alkalitolerans TaxID=2799335 RepID=UPI0018F2E331|nr:hypothetical protein [Paenibacillus alkalitolerans]
MDKETQEGMKNLDMTAEAGELVKAASTKHDAELGEEQQEAKVTGTPEYKENP